MLLIHIHHCMQHLLSVTEQSRINLLCACITNLSHCSPRSSRLQRTLTNRTHTHTHTENKKDWENKSACKREREGDSKKEQSKRGGVTLKYFFVLTNHVWKNQGIWVRRLHVAKIHLFKQKSFWFWDICVVSMCFLLLKSPLMYFFVFFMPSVFSFFRTNGPIVSKMLFFLGGNSWI